MGEIEKQYANVNLQIVKYMFTMSNGRKMPTVAIWKGKQAKPYFHYRYQNEQKRAEAIAGQEANALANELAKIERKAAKKAWKHNLKVGQIFYCSWGYGQTNVDWYEIVEVKGKTVVIQEIAGKRTVEGMDCGYSTPVVGGEGGKKMTKIPQMGYDNEPSIRITSYACARLWDGEKKYVSWYH